MVGPFEKEIIKQPDHNALSFQQGGDLKTGHSKSGYIQFPWTFLAPVFEWQCRLITRADTENSSFPGWKSFGHLNTSQEIQCLKQNGC